MTENLQKKFSSPSGNNGEKEKDKNRKKEKKKQQEKGSYKDLYVTRKCNMARFCI